MRNVIAIYVENKYGVLTRVAGLIMRRGFNIDTLTVGETENPDFSRITITLQGDEDARVQIINQLKKLHNVKKVELLEAEETVERELLLMKVKNDAQTRGEVLAAAEIYRAKFVDYNTDTMTVEVTGEPSKIQAFIEVMMPLGIVEMCRTGIVALQRGSKTLVQNQ